LGNWGKKKRGKMGKKRRGVPLLDRGFWSIETLVRALDRQKKVNGKKRRISTIIQFLKGKSRHRHLTCKSSC